MLETVGAWSGFVLILIFFSIILGFFFMWGGSKAAGIESLGIKKIFFAAIIISLVVYFITFVFSALPFFSTISSYCVGLFLSLFLIKIILNLSFQQSLLIWVFNIGAQILTAVICAQLFIGGFKDLIKII